MKKIFYILLLQLLLSENFQSIGVFTNNSNSFENIALSGATTAWIEDISSISSNPAGLSKMEGISFDLGLSTESENVDNYSDLAAQFNVRGIPNLLVFNDGKAQEQLVGLVPEEQIIDILNKFI